MTGTVDIHFSELFIDTVNTHGINWAIGYYCNRGMKDNEFWFWVDACAAQLSIAE